MTRQTPEDTTLIYEYVMTPGEKRVNNGVLEQKWTTVVIRPENLAGETVNWIPIQE